MIVAGGQAITRYSTTHRCDIADFCTLRLRLPLPNAYGSGISAYSCLLLRLKIVPGDLRELT